MSYTASASMQMGRDIARTCARLQGHLKHSRLSGSTGEPNKTPDQF